MITSPLRVLPDFLIIGAMRGGTSSLYHYLVQHPCIAHAQTKEVHYFDSHYQKGPLWYRAHFDTVGSKWLLRARGRSFVTGEATAYYLFHPQVPTRVFRLMPRVKLIALLRNPVDRAYSHYQRAVRRGREKLSFDEAIRIEAERLKDETQRLMSDESYQSLVHRQLSYLARGIYVDQLKRWLDLFPRERLLIIKSEDFFADVGRTLDEAQRFIGVPSWNIEDRQVYKQASYSKLEPATRQRLVEYFAPHNRRLKEFLGQDFGWDR